MTLWRKLCKWGAVCLSIFFVIGCAAHQPKTYRAIMQDAAMVDKLDGVDQDEAKLLAQNAIIKRGLTDRLHSLEPFDIKERTVWYRDGEEVEFITPSQNFIFELEETWRVLFKDKQGSFFAGVYPIMPFYVDIDRNNGEVIRFGLLQEGPQSNG